MSPDIKKAPCVRFKFFDHIFRHCVFLRILRFCSRFRGQSLPPPVTPPSPEGRACLHKLLLAQRAVPHTDAHRTKPQQPRRIRPSGTKGDAYARSARHGRSQQRLRRGAGRSVRRERGELHAQRDRAGPAAGPATERPLSQPR